MKNSFPLQSMVSQVVTASSRQIVCEEASNLCSVPYVNTNAWNSAWEGNAIGICSGRTLVPTVCSVGHRIACPVIVHHLVVNFVSIVNSSCRIKQIWIICRICRIWGTTLHCFAQQWTCFLAQGVQHHCQLHLRPLIRADTLFFHPFFVGFLRGITTYIDGITKSSNISRGVANTMILSRGHNWIAISIQIWKNYPTLFQVPSIYTQVSNTYKICRICKIW